MKDEGDGSSGGATKRRVTRTRRVSIPVRVRRNRDGSVTPVDPDATLRRIAAIAKVLGFGSAIHFRVVLSGVSHDAQDNGVRTAVTDGTIKVRHKLGSNVLD